MIKKHTKFSKKRLPIKRWKISLMKDKWSSAEKDDKCLLMKDQKSFFTEGSKKVR